jgi:hypothetical protein
MRMRVLLPATLLAAGAVMACDDDDEPTGPETVTFVANLSGANERPNPVTTTATGVGTVSLDGDRMTFQVTVNGNLTSNARFAHIHVGGASVAGPVVFDFFPGGSAPAIQTGTIVSSRTVDLSATTVPGLNISKDSLVKLLNSGNAYVNVHTVTNGGGEVRGQLVRQ